MSTTIRSLESQAIGSALSLGCTMFKSGRFTAGIRHGIAGIVVALIAVGCEESVDIGTTPAPAPAPAPTPAPTSPPGFDGVNPDQVGDEFGQRSTTGRSFGLTCTNDVVFSNAGTVVLPSVDIVALPTEAGTITLEYDAYDIPDRFVVEVDGRIAIDTRYVGSSSYTVSEVNDVLRRYGFQQTTQSRIITPGRGTTTFQKRAGSTSAVVRIYAPLPGTQWKVTLRFTGGSCGSLDGLYGALAYSLGSQCSSYSWGMASNFSDRNTARQQALSLCTEAEGTNCSVAEFGSAYAGNNQCIALAYGEDGSRCGLGVGRGDTESAAQRNALAECRSGGFTCSIASGRTGRAVECTE